MNDILKITLVQPYILWQDIPGNLKKYDTILNEIKLPVDCIILPETFATGFLRNPNEISEKEYNLIPAWMVQKAKLLNTCIAGSNPYRYEGKYYNRFTAAFPDGKMEHYDKRHVFTMGGEKEYFHGGRERMIFEIKGWKIMPLVCYDLRFPVWSRNNLHYDLLLYVANWPKARNHVWETLLMARAMENQCYVAGINRIGTDGQGVEYKGQSQVISPKGEIIAKLDTNEDILTVSLSRDELQQFRKKFPAWNDADDFKIL